MDHLSPSDLKLHLSLVDTVNIKIGGLHSGSGATNNNKKLSQLKLPLYYMSTYVVLVQLVQEVDLLWAVAELQQVD